MIGRNRNTYAEVNAPLAITLNTSTYTDVLVANPKRLGYKIGNMGAHDLLVKEMEGTMPDQLDRGFPIFKRSLYETPNGGDIAVGIISVKALSGTPSIFVVEN